MFRQHAATEIAFGLGLTGILGPKGAGKSTILEAIGWAIYGSAAARGMNETIPFNRAPPRSRVEVELSFELAGHQYRVVRTMYKHRKSTRLNSSHVAISYAVFLLKKQE